MSYKSLCRAILNRCFEKLEDGINDALRYMRTEVVDVLVEVVGKEPLCTSLDVAKFPNFSKNIFMRFGFWKKS